MVHAFGAEEREGSELLRQWHERCGHLNFDDLSHLSLVTPGMQDLSKCARYKCHCCWKAKAVRKAHPKSTTRRATEKLGRVHMDFSGQNRSGAAVVEALKLFFAEEGVPLEIAGVFRSDNAKEFAEGALPEFLKEMGIGQEFSAPEEPEQNGVAEQMMRTLKEMCRCLLMQSGLSARFWGYAIQLAAKIRGNALTLANPQKKTPN
eukprot:852046-Rhodomonas_salina.1